MSPPEIAFLALGLIVGAATGAAIVEALRTRPIPRREVRLTVSPNSILPRRPSTLATADRFEGLGSIPGSPADEEWLERRLAGVGIRTAEPPEERVWPAATRTRVPSAPVSVPASAVAVPVGPPPDRAGVVADATARPGPTPDAPSATPARATTASAVLDRPGGARTIDDRRAAPTPPATVTAVPAPPAPDTELGRAGVAQGPRVVTPSAPPIGTRDRIALRIEPDPPGRLVAERRDPADPVPVAYAGGGTSDAGAAGSGARPKRETAPADSATCEAERHLVEERCTLAEAAREQSRLAAESLRQAQRAYDDLREKVDRAQAASDPRELRAAKDALHRTFRAARAAAATAAEAEDAAREWLNEINRLNTAAREAVHVVEAGNAQLRQRHPELERLAVEADAARITAESADAACREARISLARCEEAAAAAMRVPEPEPVASTLDGVWPTETEAPLPPAPPDLAGSGEPLPVTLVLRGDRQARERLVASLAGPDPEAARQWQLRIAAFVDAVAARAIEDGYLALPDDAFWGLFTRREQRDIVAALSALGFRFDGMGGFADGRAPAQRDLSLAVGYAGLDRMRIRSWPREAELPTLYAGAMVAADEWLADEAGDLSLGRMVDALGGRAAELADLWNAWGRVRPALLGIAG